MFTYKTASHMEQEDPGARVSQAKTTFSFSYFPVGFWKANCISLTLGILFCKIRLNTHFRAVT